MNRVWQFKAVFTCHVQFHIAEMGVEWFWEILELIRAADVGPAEHQGKRTQFTDILESTPDLRLCFQILFPNVLLRFGRIRSPRMFPDIVIL